MTLVDDHQIIVAPIQAIQINAVGFAVFPGQIRMIEHVIPQTILGDWVVDVIPFVGVPVLGQLFRAQDQDGFIAVFVVFDDCQGGEGLAQADAVRQDTAVVLFQFVDDGKGGVLLEVVEQVPNLALFESRCLVGQNILGDVFQKFVENVIQSKEIDEVRGILPVSSGDTVKNDFSDILELLFVVPKLFKQFQEISAILIALRLLDRIIGVVAPFTAQIHGGKAVDGHIGALIHR